MTPIGASSGLIWPGPTAPPVDPPPVDPPPPTSEGTFNLLGNPAFDPDSPVLKNELTLSGAALETWGGIRWLIDNHEARRYVENGGSNVNVLASRDNLYHYGRMLGKIYSELAITLRLTGWLKVLDEWARLGNRQANVLHIGFPNADSGTKWPTHPYRQWEWGETGSPYTGADYHLLDNPRTHAAVWQLVYALRMNEEMTSPGGVKLPNGNSTTYGGLADWWVGYLNDWLKAWRGPERDLGIAKNGSAASGWSENYRGNLHSYYRDLVGARAGSNDWPVQSRHHTHTHVGNSTGHYWIGRIVPSYAEASAVGIHGIKELYFNRNLFPYSTPYGTGKVWPRSLHFTGHGTTSSPTGNYPQPSTYVGYIVMDLFNLWLEGVLPDFPEVYGVGVARTFNAHMLNNVPSGYGMRSDLLAGGTRSSLQNANGQTLSFASAHNNGFSSDRSVSNLLSSTLCLMQAFDTPDDHMEDWIWSKMDDSGAYRDDSDEKGKPRVLSPSLGLLMKQVGARNWDLDIAA